MRTLAFIVGLAAGFWLVELAWGSAHGTTAAASHAKAAAPAPTAATTTSPAPAAASVAPAATPAPEAYPPARSHPSAYFYTFAFTLPSMSGISAEDRTDPQVAEIYRRAVLASARDKIAPLVPALGLTTTQYATLLEAVIDQAQAYRERGNDRMSTAQRQALASELSKIVEARLAPALSPDQMEKLAGLRFTAQALGSVAESFAQRGAPLSTEQMTHLLTVKPTRMENENYGFQQVAEPDPQADWMNDAQRQYWANVARWQAAGRFQEVMRGTPVKDPELRDMWPE